MTVTPFPSLTFSNTAGSFAIGSSVGGTLTVGSGSIVNNSANAQDLEYARRFERGSDV